MKVDKVYIGNIYQVVDVIKIENIGSGWNSIISQQFNVQLLKKEALLLCCGNDIEYSNFLDIETDIGIERKMCYQIGDFYISTDSKDLKTFSSMFVSDNLEMTKGKILEKYREYKRGNL